MRNEKKKLLLSGEEVRWAFAPHRRLAAYMGEVNHFTVNHFNMRPRGELVAHVDISNEGVVIRPESPGPLYGALLVWDGNLYEGDKEIFSLHITDGPSLRCKPVKIKLVNEFPVNTVYAPCNREMRGAAIAAWVIGEVIGAMKKVLGTSLSELLPKCKKDTRPKLLPIGTAALTPFKADTVRNTFPGITVVDPKEPQWGGQAITSTTADLFDLFLNGEVTKHKEVRDMSKIVNKIDVIMSAFLGVPNWIITLDPFQQRYNLHQANVKDRGILVAKVYIAKAAGIRIQPLWGNGTPQTISWSGDVKEQTPGVFEIVNQEVDAKPKLIPFVNLGTANFIMRLLSKPLHERDLPSINQWMTDEIIHAMSTAIDPVEFSQWYMQQPAKGEIEIQKRGVVSPNPFSQNEISHFKNTPEYRVQPNLEQMGILAMKTVFQEKLDLSQMPKHELKHLFYSVENMLRQKRISAVRETLKKTRTTDPAIRYEYDRLLDELPIGRNVIIDDLLERLEIRLNIDA